MSHQIDYLPVAVAVGNNADLQSNFIGSGYQLDGFVNGTALPQQANKIWRQSSMMAAALANFISNELSIDVIDDGVIATLITNLTNAIAQAARNAANNIVSVTYSATPIFDASLGSKFQIVLTGNVTSSTLVNVAPGQRLTFIIKQDATGGRTFVAPTNLPLTAVPGAANQIGIQAFQTDSAGNIYQEGPMSLN